MTKDGYKPLQEPLQAEGHLHWEWRKWYRKRYGMVERTETIFTVSGIGDRGYGPAVRSVLEDFKLSVFKCFEGGRQERSKSLPCPSLHYPPTHTCREAHSSQLSTLLSTLSPLSPLSPILSMWCHLFVISLRIVIAMITFRIIFIITLVTFIAIAILSTINAILYAIYSYKLNYELND